MVTIIMASTSSVDGECRVLNIGDSFFSKFALINSIITEVGFKRRE